MGHNTHLDDFFFFLSASSNQQDNKDVEVWQLTPELEMSNAPGEKNDIFCFNALLLTSRTIPSWAVTNQRLLNNVSQIYACLRVRAVANESA